ncbi:hypothetical protein CEB40_03030 [Lactiplantibacillus plantarum]|nr:hypothetical protein [Lactiplantibacillus plantarum]QFY64710.1 hypothetical protein CEB40_03030 [Lactiplantibacillus plantarum]
MIERCRLGGFLFVSNARPIPTSGADERPLNSVQFVVGYFDTEPFKSNIRVPSPLFRNIQLLLR